jgi:hypothetical protein
MHSPIALLRLLLASPVLGSAAIVVPPDACALVTAEEVKAAAGWAPATTKHERHGTTETCRIAGSGATQTIVIVLAKPGPKVSSSAAMAAWRRKRAEALEMKVTVEPVEGWGAPAIRTDVESSPPTVEAAVAGRLLGLTAPTFEIAKALAARAIARMS